MTRFFSYSLVVVLGIGILAMGMGAGTASASAGPDCSEPQSFDSLDGFVSECVDETNETTTSETTTEPNESSNSSASTSSRTTTRATTETTTSETTEATGSDRDGSDSVRPIDEDVSLVSWSESDGTFVMTFEHTGERPATVTLTESTQAEEGSYRFAIVEKRLLPGETTITMQTKVKGGESAVSITTPASREAGHGVGVSTGQQGANPFRMFGGTSGVLSGVGITVLLSGLAAVWVIWREESGVMKA